jgi:uncharacterized protein YcfJ
VRKVTRMKKLKFYISFALVLSFSNEVFAANVDYDYATVIDADPIFQTFRVSTPRQECWQEEVTYEDRYYDNQYGDNRYGDNRYGDGHNRNDRYSDSRYRSDRGRGVSTLVGGVLGGAIGNAMGHRKRNKQVGAVVGAVLGAAVGNAYSAEKYRDNRYVSTRIEEKCETIDETREEERIVGYNVRYRYSNSTYSTRTKVDPGDTIKVRIAISPVI